MSTVPTAAATIIPVLQAAGFAFAWKGGQYSCRTGWSLPTIRRAHGTVAKIEISGEDSRSEEQRILVRVAEVLRAAGYPAIYDITEVRVDWSACAASADRRAA